MTIGIKERSPGRLVHRVVQKAAKLEQYLIAMLCC